MPNWCMNEVTITHDNPLEITRLRDAFVEKRFLQAIDPMPEHLEKTDGKMPAWYSWRLEHWGCKWDVGEDGSGKATIVSPTVLQLSFDSPWAPPTIAYQKLVSDGFHVNAYYLEMGMCFIGQFTDGEDNSIQYSTLADIPEDWSEVWDMETMLGDTAF